MIAPLCVIGYGSLWFVSSIVDEQTIRTSGWGLLSHDGKSLLLACLHSLHFQHAKRMQNCTTLSQILFQGLFVAKGGQLSNLPLHVKVK